MKRLTPLFSFTLLCLIFMASAGFAYAADGLCPTDQFAPLCTLRLENASSITGRVITVLLVVAFLISLVFIIVGGIRWITSGGDKSKVDAARGTITGAITGLVVALLAFFILNIITYLFTKQTFMNFTIPTIVP